MSKIRTKKFIRKEAIKQQLVAAGYKVFPAYRRTHVDLYELLTIACNKINPGDPANEFYHLLEAQKRVAQGRKTNPSAWKVPPVGVPVCGDVESGSREYDKTYLSDKQEMEA